MRQKVKTKRPVAQKTENGFTLIEVTLTLAIACLMLVGLIGSTYTTIGRQRYSDSVRGFAEYMRSVYNEAISPESFAGEGNIGSSLKKAILGKILVFGYDYGDADDDRKVYTATLVGTADIKRPGSQGFIEEFTDKLTEVAIFCGEGTNADDRQTSVAEYLPLWESELTEANGVPTGATYPDRFRGTMIIARTPTSSTIHTIYAKDLTYDLRDNCEAANTKFQEDLQNNKSHNYYTISEAVGICIKSDYGNPTREVRIAADGRNASAVWTRNTDDEEGNACE